MLSLLGRTHRPGAKPVLPRDFSVSRAQGEGTVWAGQVPPTCTAATCPAQPRHTPAQAGGRGGSACPSPQETLTMGLKGGAGPGGLIAEGSWAGNGHVGVQESGHLWGVQHESRRAWPGWSPTCAAGSRASRPGGPCCQDNHNLLPRVWVPGSHGRHQFNQGSHQSTSEPSDALAWPSASPCRGREQVYCRLLICVQGISLSCTWSLRLF